MSAGPDRSAILVRLRRCEHLRAQAGLAVAHAELDRLQSLAKRLDQLQANASQPPCLAQGSDWHMATGLASRVDAARAALNEPIAAAEQKQQHWIDVASHAAARRDAAEQRKARIARAEDIERERRAALRQPPRSTTSPLVAARRSRP